MENLNQAPPAILEAIAPFFDVAQKNVLLPTGDIIRKSKYNIIATFDTSSNGLTISTLPYFLKRTSLYHNIPQITDDDLRV